MKYFVFTGSVIPVRREKETQNDMMAIYTKRPSWWNIWGKSSEIKSGGHEMAVGKSLS